MRLAAEGPWLDAVQTDVRYLGEFFSTTALDGAAVGQKAFQDLTVDGVERASHNPFWCICHRLALIMNGKDGLLSRVGDVPVADIVAENFRNSLDSVNGVCLFCLFRFSCWFFVCFCFFNLFFHSLGWHCSMLPSCGSRQSCFARTRLSAKTWAWWR